MCVFVWHGVVKSIMLQMGEDAEDDIPERQSKSSIKLVDLAQLSLDILAGSVSFLGFHPQHPRPNVMPY